MTIVSRAGGHRGAKRLERTLPICWQGGGGGCVPSSATIIEWPAGRCRIWQIIADRAGHANDQDTFPSLPPTTHSFFARRYRWIYNFHRGPGNRRICCGNRIVSSICIEPRRAITLIVRVNPRYPLPSFLYSQKRFFVNKRTFPYRGDVPWLENLDPTGKQVCEIGSLQVLTVSHSSRRFGYRMYATE